MIFYGEAAVAFLHYAAPFSRCFDQSLLKNCRWSAENSDFENRSLSVLKYVSTGSAEIAICRRPAAIME